MSAVPASMSISEDVFTQIKLSPAQTPAFVYDEIVLKSTLECYSKLRSRTGCKLLYSLKACAVPYILQSIAPTLDGFSVSSVNEATMVSNIGVASEVHFTSPGLRLDDLGALSSNCNFINFNSLTQWQRCRNHLNTSTQIGLRVNPQLSVVADPRYDPCRVNSKLGIPIEQLANEFNAAPRDFQQVSGLHFHANAESDTTEPLLMTVKLIEKYGTNILEHIEWINLGGGYLFDEVVSLDPFYEAVDILRHKYELDVFIEPGQGIIGKAGSLVTSVIDLFNNDGEMIAILDTTVNHMPEIFEYQYRPTIRGDTRNGKHEYLLAGSSCLAGDLFGDYSFTQPLAIGSQIVFENVGAYSLVKAHMFNGINLPKLAVLAESGEVVFLRNLTIPTTL